MSTLQEAIQGSIFTISSCEGKIIMARYLLNLLKWEVSFAIAIWLQLFVR